ncbi:hypothetical protein PanWU01x14_174120 [Parasponia andersonii]|uniref:Transmembrane protein n=1 Tax=Parasponia andersonii TaxID=3476 RepID=A0A2P5C8V6_PARAD|nr:hypothetical protein PanWU01x14_174120 [Parasponia andersonii]
MGTKYNLHLKREKIFFIKKRKRIAYSKRSLMKIKNTTANILFSFSSDLIYILSLHYAKAIPEKFPTTVKKKKMKAKLKWTVKEVGNHDFIQTRALFSSSSKSSSSPIMPFSVLEVDFEWCLAIAYWTALQLGILFSGTIFTMIPMDMRSSPSPCWLVIGFVNIKYESNKVTAFLAVVICKTSIH